MDIFFGLIGLAIFFWFLGIAIEWFEASESIFGKLTYKLLVFIMIICAIPILLFWAYGYFMNMTGQL